MSRTVRTSLDSLARAEREGREAKEGGLSHTVNPYGLNSLRFSPALRKAWRAGWDKGKERKSA